MSINNSIVLRPRFQRDLISKKSLVLEAFGRMGDFNDNLVVKCVDDHVFIRYPKQEQNFWTPQLHIEVNQKEDGGSKIYGLFGPSPNVWLAFMFLHFIVAAIFLGFGVWAYSNWSLKMDYFVQTLVASSMFAIWVLLYIIGRLGRVAAKPQMHKLNTFMEEVLNKI